ncbi:UNKNOWN [Stylonychia lemnae]|uniref:Uncharacterized protein n=1 Tax=Stylonychia lemnae TaxID=5949 RepID=A0A078AJQ8_STYLE|nr:UNKNOWN [Stylonychia lemnae]|eukprot:CDW82615.1 UNKNOWN [Stylonychia lemnae]
MRNHIYFKDGILQPPLDIPFDDHYVSTVSNNGDKIFKNAQKQNKDIYQEIRMLRTSAHTGAVGSNTKNKVLTEVQTHVQRQFQIDQIMRARHDGKSQKVYFGVSLDRNSGPSGPGAGESKHLLSQQQISHVIYKDKNNHKRRDSNTSSEEDEEDYSIIEDSKANTNRIKEDQLNQTSLFNPNHPLIKTQLLMTLHPMSGGSSKKFTNHDLSNHNIGIKRILKTISPSRMNGINLYEGSDRSPNDFTDAVLPADVQVIRYKQYGRKLSLIQQPSVFEHLTKLHNSKNPSPKNRQEIQNQMTQFRQRRKTQALINFQNLQRNEEDKSNVQPSVRDIVTGNNQNHLSNLKKITASQVRDSEIYKDLQQQKLIFLASRQVISSQLQKDLKQFEKNPHTKAIKNKFLRSFNEQISNQYHQSRNKSVLKAKTSEQSVANIKQSGQEFIQSYDYMRELDQDQFHYNRVLKDQSQEEIQRIDQVADMLIQEQKELQLNEFNLRRRSRLSYFDQVQLNQSMIPHQHSTSLSLKKNYSQASNLQSINESPGKQLYFNKEPSSLPEYRQIPSDSTNHSKSKQILSKLIQQTREVQFKPFNEMKSDNKLVSRNSNIDIAISNTYNSVNDIRNQTAKNIIKSPQLLDKMPNISHNKGDSNYLKKFDPSSNVQKRAKIYDQLKHKQLQKVASEGNFMVSNQEIINKIDRMRHIQPEINKKKSMAEMKRAVKIIKATIEDRESDEELQKYKEAKMQIKRDLMFSHINQKQGQGQK